MESNKKTINVAMLYKFNIFSHFLHDYFQKVYPDSEVHISTFKNYSVLFKVMEVEHIDLIFTDLSSWFNMINHQQLSQPGGGSRIAPDSKIALILQDAEIHVVDKIIKMDIDIILSMTDDSQELKQAIEHVFNLKDNVKYISDSIMEIINEKSTDRPREKLSKNEWEVIKLFSEGYSLVEIAEQRSRAISTIATQKMSAMKKLNLHNNSELMKYIYLNSI